MKKIFLVLCLLFLFPAAVLAADVQLTWTNSVTGDVDHYDIYRSNNGTGGPFTIVGTAPHEGTAPLEGEYLDQGLDDGDYCYYLKAVDAHGNESAESNMACATIDTTPPAAPTQVLILLLDE